MSGAGSAALPVKSEDGAHKLSDTASLLSSSPPSLHGSPVSTEPKSSSPSPSTEHSPCFSSFVSSVNSLLAGHTDAAPRSGEREYGSGHPGGLSQNREAMSGPGSYSPSLISPVNSADNSRMNYYTSVQSLSNHFSVNNLIYSREGTEV